MLPLRLPHLSDGRFYQLLLFQVKYRGLAVPLFGALMTSKEEGLYKAIFSKIQEDYSRLSLKCLLSDFEKCMQNALKAVWSEAEIVGCRFHYAQVS